MSSCPAKELLEEVTKPSRISLGAREISKTSKVEPSESFASRETSVCTLGAILLLILPALCLILFGMRPMLSIFIIFLAFLRVAQYFVCLVDLLKPFLGLRIVFVDVGMILLGQTAVCLTYVGLCGTTVNFQYLIIVDESHIDG
jgi:uncharacterized membrane protein